MQNAEDVKLRIAALCDIFNVLASASGIVQNLQTLPWERLQVFSAIRSNYVKMLANLEDDSFDDILWKNTLPFGIPRDEQVSLCL